jgi:hypothetical protein
MNSPTDNYTKSDDKYQLKINEKKTKTLGFELFPKDNKLHS